MIPINKVCVYCGSGHGTNPAYTEAADIVGKALAEHGLGLIYGGGSIGLMGQTAKAAKAAGAHVTGIIPKFLEEREVMLHDVDELIITNGMHERKRLMFEKADAFIALPGGIGTLEELVEMLTWSQLGRHKKPVLLANIDQFWDPLISMLGKMRKEEFIRDGMEVQALSVDKAEDIIPKLLEAAKSQDHDDLNLASLQIPLEQL
ncbi:MAG: TIGR00730 family Rossman fold protein [Cohaesibacteraceae bacterium]|nr:TIGR00730 family Rossman fold protein [Cohaesibacteraceae bacterium]